MEAHPLATLGFDPESYGAAVVPLIGSFVIGRGGITEEEAHAWWPGSGSWASAVTSTSPARSSASRPESRRRPTVAGQRLCGHIRPPPVLVETAVVATGADV